METRIVMTIIGRDQPGLVGKLATVIAQVGGNWLESRMCRLGSEFAGILRVALPSICREELDLLLRKELGSLLTITVKPDQESEEQSHLEQQQIRTGFIEITAHNRPDVITMIASVLAKFQINIEELSTSIESAPMSGELLFKGSIKVTFPAVCNMNYLKQELEKIAQDLMVDITGHFPPENSGDKIASHLGTEFV